MVVGSEATTSPELWEELEQVWEMFHVLSDRRSHAYMRPNPIQLSEIREALDEWDVTDSDERRDYLYWISRMDEIWIKHVLEKQQQEMKNQREQAGRRART